MSWIVRHKDAVTALKDVVTVAALLCGGWWTGRLYQEHRESAARLNLEQTISHYALTKDYTLLVVDVTAKNIGSVQIKPLKGRVTVSQILPLDDETTCRLNRGELISKNNLAGKWTGIAQGLAMSDDRYLEPGESLIDHFEFVFEREVQLINVYTLYFNPKLPNLPVGKLPDDPCATTSRQVNPTVEQGWAQRTTIDLRNTETIRRSIN